MWYPLSIRARCFRFPRNDVVAAALRLSVWVTLFLHTGSTTKCPVCPDWFFVVEQVLKLRVKRYSDVKVPVLLSDRVEDDTRHCNAGVNDL